MLIYNRYYYRDYDIDTARLKSLLRHTRENYKCPIVSNCPHAGQTLLQRRHFPEVTKTDEDYDLFSAADFTIKSEEKREYDTAFDSYGPQAGRLSEEKVMYVLRRFELADSTLDKIWELSDQDKDGFLDRYEWTVAIQLLVRAYEYGDEIPDQVVKSYIS